MKEIELTQGQVALVDDADYEELSQYKWHVQKRGNRFYAMRNLPLGDGKYYNIGMHRVILGLERGDKREGDHIDHNTLDNRRDNLRICTHQQNGMNQKNQLNTFSQFKGVTWLKPGKKWRAQIVIGGKKTDLGYWEDEEMAAMAYDLVARKAFGEFAYLNFPGRRIAS